MNLESIISISGVPGLQKVVGQSNNGLIVESIEDGKRFPAYAADKVSALEDISIYTENEEVPLGDVLQKMFDKKDGKEAISYKSSPDELKSFFKEVLPDYDQDRVYVSDIKKVVRWYNILLKADLLKEEKEDEKKDKKDEAVEDAIVEEVVENATSEKAEETKEE